MQNQSAVYFLFSGQGSQYYHMGAPLLRSRPIFRRWMEEFDERARPVTGLSLVDLLYDKSASKAAPLSRTLHSHPLIFMVEYALAADLIAAGCRPRGVLGMSLGECAAAAVAGILSPQDAFDLVLGQADLFERTCPPGGMLTVLAPAAFLTEAAGRTAGCSVVARNLERHGVIAGPRTGLEEIARKATAAGYVSQLLPVQTDSNGEINLPLPLSPAPSRDDAGVRLIVEEHFQPCCRSPSIAARREPPVLRGH